MVVPQAEGVGARVAAGREGGSGWFLRAELLGSPQRWVRRGGESGM